jgi:hypothetical protein
MSADNGIFILETAGPEFRVAYGQGIDNIYGKFNDATSHWEGDMDFMIDFFGTSTVFDRIENALDEAERMSYNHEYLEYGICLIPDFKELKFGKIYD